MQKIFGSIKERLGKKGLQNLVIMFVVGVLLLVASTYFARAGREEIPLQSTTAILDNSAEIGQLAVYRHSPAYAGQNSTAAMLARELEEILSYVNGAGQVRVMLTIGSGAGIFAQNTQENISTTTEEDGEGGIRNVETASTSVTYVMVRQSDGSEAPLLLADVRPGIEGVIIVAQGGGNAHVREALVRAAHTVLGIAPHLVQVFEMKQ